VMGDGHGGVAMRDLRSTPFREWRLRCSWLDAAPARVTAGAFQRPKAEFQRLGPLLDLPLLQAEDLDTSTAAAPVRWHDACGEGEATETPHVSLWRWGKRQLRRGTVFAAD
jgi:hypothetical protein